MVISGATGGGGGGSSAQIHWLATDHLGTPRMSVDLSGSLASVSRHDYLPFGEEIYAGLGGRTTTQGYIGDNTRQKFTGYEADAETGLNFAQARYQSSAQGRFISVDPLGASANVASPQSFNRYSYVENDPLNAVDPSGMALRDIGVYQTNDPEDAQIATHKALRDLQMAIDGDYATRNGGTVSYDGHNATFTRLASGSIAATVTIYGNFENVWGQPNIGAMASALRALGDLRFGRAQADPDLEQRQAYYGTADGVPDERVAHDNDDFQRINVGIPLRLGPLGLSVSYTWDKYGHKYLSLGPSVSLSPVSLSWQTGRTFLDGQNVKYAADVERVLTGSNAGGEVCLIGCLSGSYNVKSWDPAALPSGGGTMSSGVGLPNLGASREWTLFHWGGRQ